MSTDLAGLPATHATTGELGARRPATLTRRATLNTAQALLDYSAKLVVGLVLTPILVSGLGRSLFGAWQMLERLAGYVASADGRPTQALRLVVANRRTIDEPDTQRRHVGSALIVWAIFLPLWAIGGALLIWFSPAIVNAPDDLDAVVRVACALLVLSVLFGTLASIPESVLRGMNLGYKRMGLQASLSVLGGALMAGAIYGGLGLAGVAAAAAAVVIVTGLCFWLLVRRYVPWFGVARPRPGEVKSLLGISLWLTAGDLIAKLLLASDVVVLGAVVSTSAVTIYVLTSYAARLLVNLHVLSAGAVMPGVAGIIGRQTYEHAAALRAELLAVTWLFTTVAGATILIWNRTFLDLWVGPGHYAGFWPNLLIVLVAAQTAFIRSDSYILDAALQPRERVLVSALAAALTIGLAVVLTKSFGIVGLCLGLLLGRAVQSLCYPFLVRSCLGGMAPVRLRALVRPAVVMALVFASAAYLGRMVQARSWVAWGAYALLTLGLAGVVAFRLGLPADARRSLRRRLAAIRRGSRSAT